MGFRNKKLKIADYRLQIKLEAPAKINIGLLVKDKRPDGYHNIETIIVPIKLFDTINIKTTQKKGIVFSTDSKKISAGKDNLVYKAAKLFLDKTKIDKGVSIHLQKRIPIGAGLGGGSSDAGYTLIGLNRLFNNVVSFDELKKLAVKIGMDVPFFLYQKPCYALGRGEILKPIKLPKMYILLYKPDYGVPTKWAYETLDLMKKSGEFAPHLFSDIVKYKQNQKSLTSATSGIEVGLTDLNFSLKLLCKRLINNDLSGINALVSNTFESIVYSKYADLLEIKNLFLTEGAYTASLSGSGSTVFGIFNKNILKKYRFNRRLKLIATETVL